MVMSMSDIKEKGFANSLEMETVVSERKGANSATNFPQIVDMELIVEEKILVDFHM